MVSGQVDARDKASAIKLTMKLDFAFSDEPFALVPLQTLDGDRISAERQRSAQLKAEQDKQQLDWTNAQPKET